MLARLTLRKLLTLPYLLLVLLLALVIGTLSYRAGRDAIDNLSGQLLDETVSRMALATTQHLSAAQAVLEAAFPVGVPAPTQFDESTLAMLRARFWVATSIHRDPNNYAYYGDREGRFFGLIRTSDADAEVRLRLSGDGPRSLHVVRGIDGALSSPTQESAVFDPRKRPWFTLAQQQAQPLWTPIYIDFRSQELVTTHARRVNHAPGEFGGVVATDLSLQRVSTFLQSLKLSPNAVAMIVEADGQLVGISRGNTTARNTTGQSARLNAAQSDDAMVAATYANVQPRLLSVRDTQARNSAFEDALGRPVQVGYAKLGDSVGLNWWVMVAVPRSDFLADIDRSFNQTLWLTMAAALAALLIGMMVLTTIARELKKIAVLARRLGDGSVVEPPSEQRNDELGDLARSIADMQARLMTDPLTGLHNREAVMRNIQDRIVQGRRRGDAHRFAVLFVDFNRFKQINDRFGHDVGDAVLRELAARMRSNVRALDLVARYAGDEFIIVLDTVELPGDAHAVRAHLEAALRAPLDALALLAGGEAAAGATFGVAIFPDDAGDVEGLIKRADEDMYRRKSMPA